ncbi:G5 and 3D domain-containing protein [Virgibacillus siamensis]|uniref:G5 and 3D domain-containing protein n=1 Tax=Virgibacillus siamensis TaxID=480071 RepID=UPI000984C8D3|nr:G5 and 3D domain-containing protein [Virgibacillus siamensis]
MNFLSRLLPASKFKLIISCIGVMALVVFSGLILFEATKAEVAVTENGEKQTVQTHANTVKELLTELGITVGEHDSLSHRVNAQIKDGMHITYKKANKVIVKVDENEQIYFTTKDTVGEFLQANGMRISKHDEASHKGSEPIKNGLTLTINKAFQVALHNGSKKEKVWVTGGTVGELLKRNGITLDKLDKVKPAKKEKVTEDTPIKITRVNKDLKSVKETIAYDTEKREDSNLEKGKKRVISEGTEGLLVKKYEITKENGKVVNRELVGKNVKRESENRVVAFGTKVEQDLVTLSSSSSNNSSSRSNDDSGSSSSGNDTTAQPKESSDQVFTMTATAYSADCSGCSGYTATGINLHANPNKKVIAVDPSVIPLGTRVWVEGYGYAVAGDTGGGVNGHHIDVHMPTRADALAFGTRTNVTVKVLD